MSGYRRWRDSGHLERAVESAEEVLEINTFDTLVARALASLPKVLRWLAPHWDAFDQLLLGLRGVDGHVRVSSRGQPCICLSRIAISSVMGPGGETS
jgi:hypothetical protein